MARRQEFDADIALESAMQLFWAQGYAQTSVEELVQCTGVARAGLYKTYGDKLGLLESALSKYAAENIDEMFRDLKAPGAGFEDVVALFRRVVGLARSGRFGRGCFLVNTAQETRGGSGEVGRIIQKTIKFQTGCFRRALENSRSAGELRETLSPREGADALLVAFYGLSALSRAGASWKTLDHAANSALSAIG